MKKILYIICVVTSLFGMEFTEFKPTRLSPAQKDLLGTVWAKNGCHLPSPSRRPFSVPCKPKPCFHPHFGECYIHPIHQPSKKTATKPFECLICPQAFPTLLNLIYHIRTHECKFCGNLFSKDVMEYHLLECPNKKTGQSPDVEKLSSYLMYKHYPEKGGLFTLK